MEEEEAVGGGGSWMDDTLSDLRESGFGFGGITEGTPGEREREREGNEEQATQPPGSGKTTDFFHFFFLLLV